MSNRIEVNMGFQLPKMASEAVNAIVEARAQSIRVLKMMDKITWGTPSDMAALAAALGLQPQAAAGDQPAQTPAQLAQAYYAVFQTAVARIDHAAIDELARLDQG